MKYKVEHLFCIPGLLQNVDEVEEAGSCGDGIKWPRQFVVEFNGRK